MDIIIQSLGFKASQNLEDFTREKMNSLKHDKIVRANVVLYKGPDSNPENNYCEIRLEVSGNDPFVKKHSHHFETAISGCIDALNETLDRQKTKNLNRRQAASAEIQDALIEGENEFDEETDLEDVVK